MSVQDTYDSAQTWLPLVRESHMLICNDGMLWSLHIVDKTYQLDSMSWFSHRRRTGRKSRPRGRLPNKMPHFQFLSPVTVTLTFDLDTRTRARFLYNALNRQVSSSYVLSFGSDRVNKQTNRQTDKQSPLKTPTSLQCPLCYTPGRGEGVITEPYNDSRLSYGRGSSQSAD